MPISKQTMETGSVSKKTFPPLFCALLLAACDNGVVLNSSAAPNPPLSPPSGMTVEALSPSRTRISWSSVPAAEQYLIYKETDPLVSGAFTVPIASVTPLDLVFYEDPAYYEDTGLSPGSYYYEVSAIGGGGTIELPSRYGPVTTLPKLQTPVPRASAQSPVSIKLNWKDVPDASSYEIYKASAPSTSPPPPLPASPSVTVSSVLGTVDYTYYDVAIPPAYYDDTTSYYYWVKAIGPPDSGEGSLPMLNGVIQGVKNEKPAVNLTVTTAPLVVSGGLPWTVYPGTGAIQYYYFSTGASVSYEIEFFGLANNDGVRFSVYLETSGGQQQLLNITDAGDSIAGKSYTIPIPPFIPPVTTGVVLISSDGRTNFGNFTIKLSP